tara:strand:+ start:50 stop:805 length:756 start_codon:yes stop_codon:yes gene_type:complete
MKKIKPIQNMKKLILLLFIPIVFACDSDFYFNEIIIYDRHEQIAEKLIIDRIEKDKREDIKVTFLGSKIKWIGTQTRKGEYLKYNPDAKDYKIYHYRVLYKIDSKDYQVYDKEKKEYINIPYESKILFNGQVSLYLGASIKVSSGLSTESPKLYDPGKPYYRNDLHSYKPKRTGLSYSGPPKIPYTNHRRRMLVFFPNDNDNNPLEKHPDPEGPLDGWLYSLGANAVTFEYANYGEDLRIYLDSFDNHNLF